jgi:hypothetical protein
VDRLSEDGLAFVATARLSDEQRRNCWRACGVRPPNLVELVAADLAVAAAGASGTIRACADDAGAVG